MCAVLGPFWFPFMLVLVWALVFGVWGLARGGVLPATVEVPMVGHPG
ncbi:MAG: hypothetical protein ACXVXC_03295 [Nocardioidaceae bacterium]